MSLKTVIASLFKVFAIMLVLIVLLPSIVKFSHAFNHHKHDICDSDNTHQTHFHKSDLDCDFYKFKLTTQYYIQMRPIQMVSIDNNFKITASQYAFVSEYQKLQTTLRGPPQLI